MEGGEAGLIFVIGVCLGFSIQNFHGGGHYARPFYYSRVISYGKIMIYDQSVDRRAIAQITLRTGGIFNER